MGPFLSDMIPKIGPINIIEAPWMAIKNCKALPFIPIIAPNVLPVVIIKEIGKLNQNETRTILQNLKVLITFLILSFLYFSIPFNSCKKLQ